MNFKKSQLIKLLSAFLCATLFTALMLSGLLGAVDNTFCDALYQHPQALDGNIVLVGIDRQSIADLGRFQDWGRDVLAQTLEALNADPENRPAAIGVDILFAGDTNPELDVWLAEAAGVYGNVVTATTASFDSTRVEQADGSFYMDNFAVLSYEEPYPALRDVTTQGHINAMLDSDGILRHALLQIDLPDGRTIPSFHRQLYRLYAKTQGLDPERVPPTSSRHFWYLPFQANSGGYDEGISVSALIAGEIPSDSFAGKIVLIGPYASGLQDNYFTAVDHADPMYGVEYQANAIDAMLRGDFKTEPPLAPQAAVLFLFSFFCLLWFWNRRMLSATVSWLLLAAGAVWGCQLAYELGYVLRALYLPLAATLLYIGSVAFNYVRAAMEKQAVTNTFKRYVAPEIVTELLKEGTDSLALGGKLTDIAVLFVDIRGFTSLSEVLPPEQVVELLNRYLTLTSGCILQNGGTLDKFVGDCTMAFWGAPLPQEDCIFKAVKTGLDMVAGAQALSAELTVRFGRTADFGVGIHYGPAVVGNVGAPNRMDYTAIGDTVNTAARLESNAVAGQVLVSCAVAESLAGRVQFTSLGSIPLKGKAAGFEVLSVDGLAPTPKEEGL